METRNEITVIQIATVGVILSNSSLIQFHNVDFFLDTGKCHLMDKILKIPCWESLMLDVSGGSVAYNN